jgi:signal transduction histidine kinase
VVNSLAAKFKSRFPDEGVLLEQVSNRITVIANDLLNQTRDTKITSTSTIIENQPFPNSTATGVSIKSSCNNMVEEARASLDNTQIKIHFYSENISDKSFLCNTPDLERIVSNILNNSIESISGAGFISVTLNEVDRYLQIEIRDSGVGMSSQLIANIYSSPTSTKINGNGIGLHSAIKSIDDWNGNLKISSTEKKGTTITISLIESPPTPKSHLA